MILGTLPVDDWVLVTFGPTGRGFTAVADEPTAPPPVHCTKPITRPIGDQHINFML